MNTKSAAGNDLQSYEVHLPLSVRTRLCREAELGHPHEVCGVLVGISRGRAGEVRLAWKLRNVCTERAHDRFEFAPEDLKRAFDQATEFGFDIIGIWHTHPDHPAKPSETDRAAAWENWSYVILSVSAEGVQDLRSWRLFHGQFQEEKVISP